MDRFILKVILVEEILIPQKVSKLDFFVKYFPLGVQIGKNPRIFMNGLEFLVLNEIKCYHYISFVTFLSVRDPDLFVIFQFRVLDLLIITKQ